MSDATPSAFVDDVDVTQLTPVNVVARELFLHGFSPETAQFFANEIIIAILEAGLEITSSSMVPHDIKQSKGSH